ncbi:MAG TPA: hypothetical protein VGP82_19340 [Ktedonobacterales bacterium]|jgi:hypothetical protein|nr:hypothetical protein [Ktedonobacterales bacterium]
MLVPPLVGAASDCTPGPLGRRRPFIAGGTLRLRLGAWQLAAAPTLVLLAAGFSVFQLGSNARGPGALAGSVVIATAEGLGASAVGNRIVFALAAVFLLRVRSGLQATGPARHVPTSRRVSRGWRLASHEDARRARGFLRVWPA